MLNLEHTSIVQQARYQDLLQEANRERQIQSVQGSHLGIQVWNLLTRMSCYLSIDRATPACTSQPAT
jgi:hypothetical protein